MQTEKYFETTIIPEVDEFGTALGLDEFKAMSNDRISISTVRDFLIIKSKTTEYADSLKLDFIEDIVLEDEGVVSIYVPKISPNF